MIVRCSVTFRYRLSVHLTLTWSAQKTSFDWQKNSVTRVKCYDETNPTSVRMIKSQFINTTKTTCSVMSPISNVYNISGDVVISILPNDHLLFFPKPLFFFFFLFLFNNSTRQLSKKKVGDPCSRRWWHTEICNAHKWTLLALLTVNARFSAAPG